MTTRSVRSPSRTASRKFKANSSETESSMTDWFVGFGAFCFGTVIGWVMKEAMVRTDRFSVSHVAVVVGAVGGAGITTLFHKDLLFAAYCVGLAGAFFLFTLLYDVDEGGN